MFENLTDKLEQTFKRLRGHGRITESNVAESLRPHPPLCLLHRSKKTC